MVRKKDLRNHCEKSEMIYLLSSDVGFDEFKIKKTPICWPQGIKEG